MGKSQTTTINIFLLLLFHTEELIFCQKTYLYFATFVFQFFRVVGYWKCSNKKPTPIQINIGLVEALFRLKILGNRLGILPQILIAVEYCFLFFPFAKENFDSPKEVTRFTCFSNYLYPKDMHITLKEIEKILFALVVKTLLICKSLKFTAAFTKKIKLKF